MAFADARCALFVGMQYRGLVIVSLEVSHAKKMSSACVRNCTKYAPMNLAAVVFSHAISKVHST